MNDKVKVAEKDVNEETGTVSIAFTNGTSLSAALSELSEGIVQRLALHGLSQKLGDSYASVKGDVGAAVAKAQDVLDRLMAGEWAGAGSGGGMQLGELSEAIARIKNVPLERATAAVAGAPKEKITAWRANAKIKQVIAEIRLEKAKARAEGADDELEVEGLEE